MTDRKRARTEDSKPDDVSREDYVKELKEEQTRLEASSFPHIARLVEVELDRMTQPEPAAALPENPTLDAARGVIGPSMPPPVPLKTATEAFPSTLPWDKPKDEEGFMCVLMPDEEAPGGRVKSSKSSRVNAGSVDRGRAAAGAAFWDLKRRHVDSGCKISIRGKGSFKFKDNQTEQLHHNDPFYAHLNEDFHVFVEYEGEAGGRNQALQRAEMLVRTVQGGGTIPMTANAYAGSYPHMGHGSVTGGYGQVSSSSADQQYAETLVATGQIVGVLASHVEVGGGRCQTSIKVYVPEKSKLGCSRGKLLGQKGSTLKQLQAECGCKMSIRGRSSMKVPAGETNESMAASNPTYAHLREALHVLCEYEGPSQLRDATLQGAESLIRSILTPVGDASPGQFLMSQYEVMQQHYKAQMLHAQPAQHFAGAYAAPPPQQPPPAFASYSQPQQPQQQMAYAQPAQQGYLMHQPPYY